ncbi:MAG: rhomboid family intramembrane serine protease [Ectothiorhodospiraceae bacterium]|nr:rhomboid family intramembrane serine protease [Ectothiorhodospiraceae bacterium]
MLLIPFDRKLDWRRPPLATLGLILANILVYIVFQTGDYARLADATDFYQESGLKDIELTEYQAALRARGERDPLLRRDADEVAADEALWTIISDSALMQQINNRTLLASDHAQYPEWRANRAEFEARMERVVFWAHGLKPAEPDLFSLFTHMFLHGGGGHLIGNMLFLLAVGFLVEGVLGTRLMLATYLLAGVLAGAADFVVAADRFIPGVGASGAIAGLMGMYCVLFGWTRVQFFYFVWVYFNVTRAPALLLLPLWLGYEVVSWLWLSDGSNINYAAHAAGLSAGAAIAFGLRRFWPESLNHAYVTEQVDARNREQQLEDADAHLRALEFEQARPLIEDLLLQSPDDLGLLKRLHRCLRLKPDSEAYHRTSQRILESATGPRADRALILETFRDYTQRARPKPRISGRMLQTLGLYFARQGELREAEKLTQAALRNKLPDAPAMLVALAEAHLRAGHPERAQRPLQTLTNDYPASSETEYARNLLRQTHGGVPPGG